MPTIRELRALLQPSTGTPYERFVARRFSIYVTALCLRLGMGPNAASVVGLACGALGCVLVGLGDGAVVVTGVALWHLYEVFDCVDGELARHTQRYSTQGLFLENYSAYTLINGSYLAVAFYLWRLQDLQWPVWAAVLLVAFSRNAAPVARRTVLEVLMREVKRPQLATRDPGQGAAPPVRLGRLGRARQIVAKLVPTHIEIRILLSTVLLLELWLAQGRGPLLAVVFAACVALQVAREVGAIALYLFTDALDRELAQLSVEPKRE